MSDVTRIMAAIEQGDRESADRLLPLIYDEFRSRIRQKAGSKPRLPGDLEFEERRSWALLRDNRAIGFVLVCDGRTEEWSIGFVFPGGSSWFGFVFSRRVGSVERRRGRSVWPKLPSFTTGIAKRRRSGRSSRSGRSRPLRRAVRPGRQPRPRPGDRANSRLESARGSRGRARPHPPKTFPKRSQDQRSPRWQVGSWSVARFESAAREGDGTEIPNLPDRFAARIPGRSRAEGARIWGGSLIH